MNVLLIARRKHHIQDVATRIRSTVGVTAHCLACDLGNYDTIAEVESELVDKDVGVLVYNAAQNPLGSFLHTDEVDIEQALAVNVRGPVALIRSTTPRN